MLWFLTFIPPLRTQLVKLFEWVVGSQKITLTTSGILMGVAILLFFIAYQISEYRFKNRPKDGPQNLNLKDIVVEAIGPVVFSDYKDHTPKPLATLNQNIRTLLSEVVAHKIKDHTRERNNEVREFIFEMSRKGSSQSDAFINGKTDIYCEAFDKFAISIWTEMQRVLNSCGFEYYTGCENDLIKFLKGALTVCGTLDSKSLFDNKDSGITGIQAHNSGRFNNRRENIAEKLTTEIKIFTSKLLLAKEFPPKPSNQIPYPNA